MKVVYNENFPREVDRQVEYRAGKVRVAEEVSKIAKTIAPVRSGAYKSSLQVKVIGPAVYVTATDWKGHWMEWGSQNNPTSAPIRRATLMSGLRIDEAERTRGGNVLPRASELS